MTSTSHKLLLQPQQHRFTMPNSHTLHSHRRLWLDVHYKLICLSWLELYFLDYSFGLQNVRKSLVKKSSPNCPQHQENIRKKSPLPYSRGQGDIIKCHAAMAKKKRLIQVAQINSQNTLLNISHKLVSNDRQFCVSVCFKSVYPLPEVNTHQKLRLSLSFFSLSSL